MASVAKLRKAADILERELAGAILQLTIDEDTAIIHASLKDATELYLHYNDYGEYTYSILFSELEMDRCRFDNYDDKWKVLSRPHHFHPAKTPGAFDSPMRGEPDLDLPLLLNLLKTGKLTDPTLRF